MKPSQGHSQHVEVVKPQREQYKFRGAEIKSTFTSAQEATANVGLIVPPGVKVIKSQPWLTRIDIG